MAELKANTEFEKALKNYLDSNISSTLRAKILQSSKTLKGCADYIIAQMKNKAQHGCAIATDQEVFGMAVHFFEEDEISNTSSETVMAQIGMAPEPKAEPVTEKKPEPKKVEKKDNNFQLEGQMNIFDFLGA